MSKPKTKTAFLQQQPNDAPRPASTAYATLVQALMGMSSNNAGAAPQQALRCSTIQCSLQRTLA
jgi:hypothetical protein